MTAKDVADFLKKEDTPSDVHFINFAEKYIFELRSNDKIGSARNMQTVVYSLIDFFGTRDIFALDITAHKLFEIEAYLRKPRTLKRKHSSGGEMELKRAGATTPGIHTFMRDLRLLFNAARDKFNNGDTGKILIAHSATEWQYEGSLLSHYEQVALMEFITNYRSPDEQRKDETLQDEFPENANPPEDLPPNPGSLS